MKIGIICASDVEVYPFIQMMDETTTSEKAMLKFYEGSIEDNAVVVLYSGVCKVNAAIATQICIDTYQCDAIINAGVAGGIDPQLEILDVVVSTEVGYHDVAEDILIDFHPWLDTIYFKANENLVRLAKNYAEKNAVNHSVYFGRMITGEQFITDEHRDEIEKKFAALSVDMETCSIAHCAYVNKIPFISIRAISDTPFKRGIEVFEKNCEKASLVAAQFTKGLLKELNNEKLGGK